MTDKQTNISYMRDKLLRNDMNVDDVHMDFI